MVTDETGLMAEINFQSVEMVQAEGRGALAALSVGLAHGDLSSRAGGASVFHCPVRWV